nr:MAG TPA: hypothetical protein [Caudoviricetes sp.]
MQSSFHISYSNYRTNSNTFIQSCQHLFQLIRSQHAHNTTIN